jgi:Ni/Co efflux regulator RcnB
MDRWMISARVAALVAMAALAGGAHAAQKAAQQHKEAAATVAEQSPSEPAAGSSMGYGVKLGGFFTDQQESAAKRAFAQHFAKAKECPKDMERKGKTCRALVQGHYWAVGQSLQPAVQTYELPDEVKDALPPAPEGYEYVRAGEDILLMSKAIKLVIDVMENVVA